MLETGWADRGFWLRLPVGYYRTMTDARAMRRILGERDAGIIDRQMGIPRGRVLGGTISINGLIHIRGQRQDFDVRKAFGATGWSYRDVLPHFRASKTYDSPPSQYRGAIGPLAQRTCASPPPCAVPGSRRHRLTACP